MITKHVQKFGNGGHIILPKSYVGKRVRFIIEPKKFEDIKAELLDLVKPYAEAVIGVYVYGSYARNEQTIYSDIDVLIVAHAKLKISEKPEQYSIISITSGELEHALKHNAILILPIIKEARPVLNAEFLERYKSYSFTRQNIKSFIEDSKDILELDREGLKLDFGIGSLVYSLLLRIRSLLIIKLMSMNKTYSKSRLRKFLHKHGFSNDTIKELYRVYGAERDGKHIKESATVTKETLQKLHNLAVNLLGDVRRIYHG